MDSTALNRRGFLQCAALVSAHLSLPIMAREMTEEQGKLLQQHQDFLQHHNASLFSQSQQHSVAAIARHIIPTTETPGADEAQVSRFIELIVEHWFYPQERADFTAGLDSLINRAGEKFHQLDFAKQRSILEEAEDSASDAAWFKMGNTMRIWDSEAPFICQIKELTVLGFMLSEIGSKEFLRPNPMGEFKGDAQLNPNDSSYATQIPIRVLAKAVQ